MTPRRALLLVLAAAAALFAFHLVMRRVSLLSFNLAGTSEVRDVIDEAMRDQKQLSRLDPSHASEYRQKFERVRAIGKRLDIVALNREEIARRYETALIAVVATLLLAFFALYAFASARRERRLAVIQRALEALGRGETDVTIGDRSRDVVARIGAMIETTSRDISRDRRRLQYLDHLASWQEAARRHAHEIRTPLTAARMEVDGFVQQVTANAPALSATALQAQVSIHEELDRLREFTRQFTSFARIGQPRRERLDLQNVLDEFTTTFSGAWPRVTLAFTFTICDCTAEIDREMFRQVLVNLCNNSALAGASRVSFEIEEEREWLHVNVCDDGPGIDPSIRARLFQPYTTTRAVGEGMGLGLAISKKIVLDHGGDLDLGPSTTGALFRITLPKAARA
ncbi:MAG TPA: HAMP domain-containing sensor histidine kinase [Thermoanaerobaculia bacterium]|nr:HAMP domain-containing sensor histidine kinase [Thermoanaerobaculia bacterium]